MDTSETYIKMCDCKEVQQEWSSKTCDYYYSCGDWAHKGVTPDIPEIRTVIVNSPTYLCKQYEDKYAISQPGNRLHIWLPRQDQIQEMFGDIGYLALLNEFLFWRDQEENSELIHGKEIPSGPEGYVEIEGGFESFEQLWLAYYMYEKHGKIWDGEKWTTYQP